jgi:Transglycosylase SLT domain
VRLALVALVLMLLVSSCVAIAIDGAMDSAGAAFVLAAGEESAGAGTVSGIPYAEVFNSTASIRLHPDSPLRIDPRLVAAVAWQETIQFSPDVIACRLDSPMGARGIMQLRPGTARELGVDPCDPPEAIPGGARYLLRQYETFGSWELALAAYNAGPGAVQAAGNRIPVIDETEGYVRAVMAQWAVYKAQFPGGSITGGGPSGGPQGGTAAYRPGNIPAVTQRMLDAAVPLFGRGHGIHCQARRSDPRSDHNSGHACDFMVSPGGVMPTRAQARHGDELAAWAQANADALDIQYVIWENEIWNADRPEDGWRSQGKSGVTYAHWDHVHISLRGSPTYG